MTTTAPAPTTFAEAQAILAANLPGYTRRPPQEALAAVIEQAIRDGQIALTEAGCGTGKSLAGLIPAIIKARQDGVRTVVATATKALQDQYAGHDLPFLEKYLGDFAWAILKGRSNYLCHAKAAEVSSPTPGQRTILKIVEAKQAMTGDRAEFPAVEDREWMDLSISASECPGKKNCPFAKECFAEKAKDRAAEADIVVTNLAYLLTDLVIRSQTEGAVSLLGEIDQLIIDEAHNLEDAATGALSDSIGPNAFARLARDVDNFLHDARLPENGYQIQVQAEELWAKVVTLYTDWLKRNRISKPEPMPLPVRTILDELKEEFFLLISAIDQSRGSVKDYRPEDPRDKLARYRLLRRLEDWKARLTNFVIDQPERTVRWVEQEEVSVRGRRELRTYLRSAPVHVGPFLRENLWSRTPAILMSATLAVGRKFDYIAERLGLDSLDEAPVEFITPSPFDFGRQARIYVPPKETPIPSGPTSQAWRAYAQQVTRHLVIEADGGALLLFTSRSGLNDTYRTLAEDFRSAGLTVLKQGDAPTPELIRRFKEGRGVLFGLKSFFEGIDVQGEACRLVVIDKLPFAVPTDVLVQARYAAYERRFPGRKSFSGMSMPTMALVLIQGFGRLIRHASDRGVVAILDPRLTSKNYGSQILNQLPPAPVTTDIHEAVRFFAG